MRVSRRNCANKTFEGVPLKCAILTGIGIFKWTCFYLFMFLCFRFRFLRGTQFYRVNDFLEES